MRTARTSQPLLKMSSSAAVFAKEQTRQKIRQQGKVFVWCIPFHQPASHTDCNIDEAVLHVADTLLHHLACVQLQRPSCFLDSCVMLLLQVAPEPYCSSTWSLSLAGSDVEDRGFTISRRWE